MVGMASASEGLDGCLRGGRASEDLRKSMNEVLPEFFAPMTRIL